MDRVRRLKLLLWMPVGLGFAVTVDRFFFGLGAATHLSDATPWGLWIGFDVMSGVALAAGGFVLTATVYIFRLERFHSIVRPAVLTAFLGYVAVVAGLLFDLGLPWHIWHLIIYWNPHSPLFEVGWCVMLYLTVLTLEFFPVPAEDVSSLARVRRFLVKMRIPLVILGIALSTLHQSSLGSLFLIMPYRLYPLWYSPILPVLFFISAIALGLMMAIFESHFTAYFYRRKPETAVLASLASAARWVLILYLVVRFSDLAARGQLHDLVGSAWQVKMFWFEIVVAGLLPVVLFSISKFNRRPGWQWGTAAVGVGGIVLDRVNVGGLIDLSRGAALYLPSWQEIVTSLAIVAGAVLVFLFIIEHFRVWEERPVDPKADPKRLPELNPVGETWLGAPVIAARIKYSLAFVLAAALAFSFLANPKVEATGIVPVPAHRARGDVGKLPGISSRVSFNSSLTPSPSPASGRGGTAKRWVRAKRQKATAIPAGVLYLDGDLTGWGVTFYHQREVERNGGEKSCAICHHMNMPHDQNSGCYECHRDMYQPTDAFRHNWHASRSGANLACIQCHEAGYPRTSAQVKPCTDCHKDMIPPGATIQVSSENLVDASGEIRRLITPGSVVKINTYTAVSYVDAMHELCVGCHAQVAEREKKPEVAQCAECHKGKLNYSDTVNLFYQRTAVAGRRVVMPPPPASPGGAAMKP